MLIKLEEKLSFLKPICLPGPNFQDTSIKAELAGYGRYFRSECITTSHSPMKYHYCQMEMVNLWEDKISFHDGIKQRTGITASITQLT